MTNLIIKLPKKIRLFLDRCLFKYRFLTLKGGRGGGKSESIARVLVALGYQKKMRILCTREVQNSIKDSVHSLLKEYIESEPIFSQFYHITDKSIRGANGTEFIFKGLYHTTTDSLKSLNKIDICWVEEAHSVSRRSLDILIPTIRTPKSFFIFTYNPDQDDDPVHVDYSIESDDIAVLHINYDENEFCPDELKIEAEKLREKDYERYANIWLGETRSNSDAQIFKGRYTVKEFDTPDDAFFYIGADWGFSKDPTTTNRMFMIDNTLYIDHETHSTGLDVEKLVPVFKIPEYAKHEIVADNARPENISYMRRKGIRIRSCSKWNGSVEDGYDFLLNLDDIVIHPRCKHTIEEFRKHSYIVDKRTDEISNKIEDANNHHVDGIRYGLEKSIRNRNRTKGLKVGA